MSQLKRKCAHCGGPVHLVRFNGTIEHPVVDEMGRCLFETVTDPETGQPYERQVTRKVAIQGLGTWKCSRRCKDSRTVIVPRYIGPGKEADRGSITRGHNLWHGMDIADEAMQQREVVRPIAVVTTYKSSEEAK